MKREEAIALLKELINNKIVQPTGVSMEEKEFGNYELRMKSQVSNPDNLKQILAKNGLTLKNEVEGIMVIHCNQKALVKAEL